MTVSVRLWAVTGSLYPGAKRRGKGWLECLSMLKSHGTHNATHAFTMRKKRVLKYAVDYQATSKRLTSMGQILVHVRHSARARKTVFWKLKRMGYEQVKVYGVGAYYSDIFYVPNTEKCWTYG